MDWTEWITALDFAALIDSPVVGNFFAAFHSALPGITVLSFCSCFLGYRIFRIFAALCGLGIGAAIGALLMAMEPGNTAMMLMGILSAIVLAAMTFIAFRFAAFLMGAFCGVAIGLVLIGWQSISLTLDLHNPTVLAGFAAELVIPAVLLGLMCILFYRPMIILSTSLMGIVAVYGVFELLLINLGPVVWVLGAACAVLGSGIQFHCNPKGTLPGPGKWPDALPDFSISLRNPSGKPAKAAKTNKSTYSVQKTTFPPKSDDATTWIAAGSLTGDMEQTTRITPEQMRARMAQAASPEPEIVPEIDMDTLMDRIQESVGETVREMQHMTAEAVNTPEEPFAEEHRAEATETPACKPIEEALFHDIEQAIQNRIEAEQPRSPDRFCIKCGTRNPIDSKFCIHCGRKLL